VHGHVEVDKVRLAIIIAVEVDEQALVELLIHVKDGGWCGRRFWSALRALVGCAGVGGALPSRLLAFRQPHDGCALGRLSEDASSPLWTRREASRAGDTPQVLYEGLDMPYTPHSSLAGPAALRRLEESQIIRRAKCHLHDHASQRKSGLIVRQLSPRRSFPHNYRSINSQLTDLYF
jgi:hypothetical protein